MTKAVAGTWPREVYNDLREEKGEAEAEKAPEPRNGWKRTV